MATAYNPSQQRITDAYEKGIAEIQKYLVEQLSLDHVDIDRVIDLQSILGQLADELLRMDAEVSPAVAELLSEKFKETSKAFYAEIGIEADYSFSQISQQKLKVIIADTMSDLLAATANTDGSLKQLVRETVEKRLQLSSMQGEGWEQISKQLTEELSAEGFSKLITDQGFVGIIDAAGKKWNLQTYAEMVVQTKLKDADIEASRVEGLQTGVDLAVISQHGAKDACSKWENCIVSMNGMTEGYPTYAEIKATNECFHPNCQHHLQPVRDVSLIHPEILKKDKQKMIENQKTLQNM